MFFFVIVRVASWVVLVLERLKVSDDESDGHSPSL